MVEFNEFWTLTIKYVFAIMYVNFEKAFDRIYWAKLMAILADTGADWRDKNLTKELYCQSGFCDDKTV